MSRGKREYTETDLYGVDGHPHASDIDQDDLFNCYLLAPMGALGEKQPDRIRDAIRFNPESGDFTVTLYRPPNALERSQGQTNPIQESVTVSQDDIRRNIDERGGGTVDNSRQRTGPLWPTVIEAGFAELYGRDSQGRINLDRGYNTLGDHTLGGVLSDGTYALTGESGRNIQIKSPDAPRLIPTGPDHVVRREAPPYRAPSTGATLELDAAHAEVKQALAADRPVSMSTQGRDVHDGLEEGHAYMVVGVSRDPLTNEALITLRNPYGNNQRANEGNQNIGADWNTKNPEITVSLSTLVKDGSFGEFNIGPAPRVQTRQQDADGQTTPDTASPATSAPSVQDPSSSTMSEAVRSSDPRHPEHPDHRLYTQIESGVRRIDATIGRSFDDASERLAMTAFHDAKAAGITSADHVALNTVGKPQADGTHVAAGTLLFVVQGQDPSDPAALRSTTDVKQAIEQPIERTLQNIERLEQQQVQSQLQAPPTQDNPTPKGPSL
jgi:hypothetical protein